MKHIFIDIGAHIGESVEIATSRNYNFETILAIEPSVHSQKYLSKYRDKRIQIEKFGLGFSNRKTILHGAGSVGASIYEEKVPYWSINEVIEIKKFSEWYKAKIDTNSLVWIKLNIEGAEYEIIQELNLIDVKNIVSILISFDVDKIPSMKDTKPFLLKILKNDLKVEYIERTEDLDVKSWLDSFSALRNNLSLFPYLINSLRLDIPLTRNFRRIIRPLAPKKIWLFLALNFGPNRKR